MKYQNDEQIVENMKSYASNKYGREFTFKSFLAAKDETYSNILTLNDGKCNFNVYQSEGYEAADDYVEAIVSYKIAEAIKTKTGYKCDIFANVLFVNGSQMSLDYVSETDVTSIVEDNPLLKIIVIVVVDKNISEYSEELFSIYKEALAFNPRYIDFEAIQVENMDSGLSDMLNNLLAFYDSDWEKNSQIIDYLSVVNTSISTADELLKGGK